MQSIPDNVRVLKPAEVVQPTLDPAMKLLNEVLRRLDETRADVLALKEEIAVIKADIGMTKDVIVAVKDQVTPTLEMLQNGPIGQLLGIAPPQIPRKRRGH
jgi:hypothetical protein